MQKQYSQNYDQNKTKHGVFAIVFDVFFIYRKPVYKKPSTYPSKH